MTSEYTPDEEQVREQYTREQPPQIGTVAEKHAEFDRFIARVKANALREAAWEFAEGAWADQWIADLVSDDVSAVQSTERWFRGRAGRIEEEAGL